MNLVSELPEVSRLALKLITEEFNCVNMVSSIEAQAMATAINYVPIILMINRVTGQEILE